MESIAFQMTKNMHERMTNVEGGWGGGGVVHTKSMGKNMHRAIKWNNFANIGTIDLIFVSLYS